MSRNRINWNADPLLDELSRQPVDDDAELIGVDWGDVGRKTLGDSHLAGKTLLNLFGGGALIEPVEKLQARGGTLPTWATKSLRVDAPDFVVLSKDAGPTRESGVKSVLVFGGSRTDGQYDRKRPFGETFSYAVDGPSRVEIEFKDGRKAAHTDVKMVVFLGGVAEGNLDVAGDEVMGADLTDLERELELLGAEPTVEELLAQAAAQQQQPEMVGPPPSMAGPASTYELRRARALAEKYKQRLAAAKARQPLMPAPYTSISPMEVPSFDLNQFLRSDAMDAKDLDDVLGLDASREYEIVGAGGDRVRNKEEAEILGLDASREYEIVGAGGDRVRNKSTDEILGHLLNELNDEPAVIGSNDWVEIVGDDYQLGCDVLGAPISAAASTAAPAPSARTSFAKAPPKVTLQKGQLRQVPSKVPAAGRVAAASAASKRLFKVAQPSKKKSAHKASIERAERVRGRVAKAGAQLNNKLKQIKAKVVGPTRVRGLDAEILGAVKASVKAPLQASRVPTTPRQKLAASKLKTAQERLAKAVTKSLKKGDKALSSAQKLDVGIKKAKPAVAKMIAKGKAMPFRRATGPTKVKGDMVAGLPFVVDDPFDMMTEEMLRNDIADLPAEIDIDDVMGLEPGDEGYDPRFDDPNYSGDYSAPGESGAAPAPGPMADPLADPLAANPAASPTGSWEDYYEGDIPLPVRGQGLSKEEAAELFYNLPPDAVVYDGVSRGFPVDTFGSWNIFYGHNDPLPAGGAYPDGFTYGQMGGDPAAWLVRDKQGIVRADVGEGQVNNMSFYERPTENMKKFWPPPASIGSTKAVAVNSASRNWGPLIGSKSLNGLQYAINEDKWFWQASKAPRWYAPVAEADRAIEDLNKKARDAAKDAWEADQARANIEAAERERLAAQANFDSEMAANKAELESAITADKLNQQQAIADQQAVAMQTALDLQTQKLETEFLSKQAGLDQQVEALSIRAAQADLEYAIAHPEEAMQDAEEMYSDAASDYGMQPLEDYSDYGEGLDETTQQMLEEGNAAEYAADEAAALAMDME